MREIIPVTRVEQSWPRKCCTNQFKEINFNVCLHKKSTPFLTSSSLCRLAVLDSLGMSGHNHQKWQIKICGQLWILPSCKNSTFIPHFFPEILHLKSYHLIGQKCFGQYIGKQNFARYGVCGEIPVTIWFFISDYFKEKLMSIFF